VGVISEIHNYGHYKVYLSHNIVFVIVVIVIVDVKQTKERDIEECIRAEEILTA
jgi:putative component of toxin-antitoxin plasmid stabilization module